MNSGLLHLEHEKTDSVQLLCVWMVINKEQKNVLLPDCVTKTYSLHLLHVKYEIIKISRDWLTDWLAG
jgi:hypothetical protein